METATGSTSTRRAALSVAAPLTNLIPFRKSSLLTMPSIFLLTVSALLLQGGCGKKPPAPAAATPTNETSATSAPAATKPLDGQVNAFLTQQLQAFVQQKGRLPTDFAELARTSLDSVPRAPAGMKWAIDPTTREVKAVKQ
jgi:hypothetical protein